MDYSYQTVVPCLKLFYLKTQGFRGALHSHLCSPANKSIVSRWYWVNYKLVWIFCELPPFSWVPTVARRQESRVLTSMLFTKTHVAVVSVASDDAAGNHYKTLPCRESWQGNCSLTLMIAESHLKAKFIQSPLMEVLHLHLYVLRILCSYWYTDAVLTVPSLTFS